LIRAALIAGVGLVLAACKPPAAAPTVSCQGHRDAYDRAFKEAADYGARQDFARQRSYVDEAQKTFLAMEGEGCCRQTPNVCPTFNVH
jgi:hypothetical protein